MTSVAWIAEHWGGIIESTGIISGLFFTGHSLYLDARARRVENLIVLTKQHREIWSELFSRPKLARVLETDLDIRAHPPTIEEELFVKFLIMNLAVAYRTTKEDFFDSPERLADDIREFFSLPIPALIWDRLKPSQDSGFFAFVEESRRPK